VTGGGFGVGYQWHDNVVQPCRGDVAAELAEAVHQPGALVEQLRIVEKFSLLVFLRAAVVVQGEQGAAGVPAGQAQVDGAFAAVAADFQDRSPGAGLQRVLVECSGLVFGEKALDLVDVMRKAGNHLIAALRV
jgi:hypothetical protein